MDYVLVRDIHEFVEKNRRADGRHISLCLDGYTDVQTQYHARLCAEAVCSRSSGGRLSCIRSN